MQINKVMLGSSQGEGWTFKVNKITFIQHPEESSEFVQAKKKSVCRTQHCISGRVSKNSSRSN